MIPADMEWRSDGICVGLDTNLFFPGPYDGVSIAEARKLCESCPVRSQCYDHALRHEEFGVWAGTSERQRRQLRSQLGIHLEPLESERRPPAVCGTESGDHAHLRHKGTPPCGPCLDAHARAESARAKRRTRHQFENGIGGAA